MQQADRVVGGGEGRQVAGDGVQLADVVGDPAELAAVEVEPAGEGADVADGLRGGGDEPAVLGLVEGVPLEGHRGHGRGEHDGGGAGGPGVQGAARAAEHQEAEGRGTEHRDGAGPQDEPLHPGAHVAADLLAEPAEPVGVADELAGVALAQPHDVDVEPHRAGVRREGQLPDGRDRDDDAARQAGPQGEVDRERPDAGGEAAGHEQGEQPAEQADPGLLDGQQGTASPRHAPTVTPQGDRAHLDGEPTGP